MDTNRWGVLAFGALLCALLGAALRQWWHGRQARRQGWAHNLRGQRGETLAEQLLRRHGYQILERGARGGYQMLVDGEPREVQLCADFLLQDGNQRVVAEVKTGRRGPRISYNATRRQVLEYFLAFGVDRVLLVEPEAQRIQEIRFPFAGLSPRPRRPAWGCPVAVLGVLVLLAVLGWRWA